MGKKRTPGRSETVSEWAAIAQLRQSLSRVGLPAEIDVAIGDDAAVLGCSESLVWSIDGSVEGTHFDLRWLTVGAASARAVTAAVSDLAAMGAEPLAALCHVQLPRPCSASSIRDIARCQSRVTGRLKCPIIGGNISRGKEYQFTTSVLGKTPRPLLRSGARPGDELWLIGTLGAAAAGLTALQRASGGPRKRYWHDLTSPGGGAEPLARAVRRCVRAWKTPVARIAEGLVLRERATACMDVSDGLASDALHLAAASHVALVLSRTAVLRTLNPSARLVAAALRRDPLELALGGGEDYGLLATGAATSRPPGAAVLGRVAEGEGVIWEDGAAVDTLGFDHLGG